MAISIAAALGGSISSTYPYTYIPYYVGGLPTSQNSLRRSVYSGYHYEDPLYTLGKNPLNVTYTNEISITETGDDFSVEWLGWFRAPASDVYTFTLDSDDGSYFWIGKPAVNPSSQNANISYGFGHGMGTPVRGQGVFLIENYYYPIRILYGEGNGNQDIIMTFNRNFDSTVMSMTDYVFSEIPPADGNYIIDSGQHIVSLNADTYSGTGDWLDSGTASANAVMNPAIVTPPTWNSDFGGIFSFDKTQKQYTQLPNLGTLGNSIWIRGWARVRDLTPGGGACIITEGYTGDSFLQFALGDILGDGKIVGGYFNQDLAQWNTMSPLTPFELNKWFNFKIYFYKSGGTSQIQKNGEGNGSGGGIPMGATSGQPIYLGRRWDNPDLESSYLTCDIAQIDVFTNATWSQYYKNFNYYKYRFGLPFELGLG